MPVDVLWDDDDHTIQRFQVQDPWNWGEFYSAIADGDAKRELSSSKAIFIIIDCSRAHTLPGSALSDIRKVGQGDLGTQVKAGILVTASPLLRAIADVVLRLMPQVAHRFHYTETLENAYLYIESRKLLDNASAIIDQLSE